MQFHPVVPQRGTVLHMGMQATGYEKAASGCPDHVSTYYLMIKSKGGGTSAQEDRWGHWALAGRSRRSMVGHTNLILFHHALEYQNKLSDFLTESSEAIEMLHGRIWMVVLKVMEDAGKPAWLMAWESLCILWTCFPPYMLHLSFQSVVPGLTRFAPEVYAAWPKSRTDILDFSHMQPPQSVWRAMHVLSKEIVKNAHGTTDKVKAIQPTWLLSMANLSTIGVKAAEAGAGNGPSTSQCASHSLLAHTSVILQ